MRTIVVSRAEAGQTLAAVLRSRLSLSWSVARRLVLENRVRTGKGLCRDPFQRVRAGQKLQVRVETQAPRPRPAPRSAEKRAPAHRRARLAVKPIIRHLDPQVVVVDKPPGLTTMRHADEAAEFGRRARRFLPPTLADVLPEFLPAAKDGRRPPVIAVHRLDKDTSGLVVFARTPQAERHLGQQFRAHTVGRRYLAIVRGQAQSGRIESFIARDRGDARRGSTTQPGAGQRAVTHVRVVENLGEFTLVECRLETGRTHQVRIHLAEQGTPICGERVYDRPLHGAPLPDASAAPRLALHAASLEFDQPATGQRLSFQSGLPKDMKELLKRLRGKKEDRD
jgi:23S rRNA pseudouridine1911/1915/1917 synthase